MSAVNYCGANPSVVDINEEDYNISLEGAKNALNYRTRAIIVPHMFGNPVRNIEDFIALDLPIIEDCALSVGASHEGSKVGTFGDVSVFSFRATKMTAAGLGGMVLTDDKSLYGRLKDLTTYDNREKPGESYSYQMSDLHAALAISQLKKLDGFVNARRAIARKYSEMFSKSSVDFDFPKPDGENIFFRYIIRHPESEELINNLRGRGVDAARPVFMPLHRYQKLDDSHFPNTVRAYETAVSIPIYPRMLLDDGSLNLGVIQDIAGVITNWRYEKINGGQG
jgi:perosamine synthetase